MSRRELIISQRWMPEKRFRRFDIRMPVCDITVGGIDCKLNYGDKSGLEEEVPDTTISIRGKCIVRKVSYSIYHASSLVQM